MKIRALTLGFVSVATLLGAAVPEGAMAQGLRPSGSAQAPRLSPNVTLPANTNGRPVTRAADFIVAVVNSEPITNNDVQIRMERVRAQAQAQGAALPPENLLAKETLERLIMEKIQIQNAKEFGLKVDDFAVSQAVKSVAQQNKIDEDEMIRRLAKDGITKEPSIDALRRQAVKDGMRPLRMAGALRVAQGVTTLEEVVAATPPPR